ncbi:hypothetical protein MNQ96_12755 [Sphingopyxis granuli]|uniref:hypothetical protein n=1 Tax=Sphingopyxis granuli TaxID=267128 RepID=UPI001F53DE02|nr:hypothetical protein [Sphingopyxis granuli]UNK78435.1 hypothetical protein MNQ96_12755 [Sphingopyxis granuli]
MDKSTAGNGGSCKCGVDAAERETLNRYGITRVPVATYLLDGYRYTSLADAVAQARRSRM